jgi:hypothetical protein
VVLVGMTTFVTVLLIWAAVLVVLVAALSLGTRRRRTRGEETIERRGLPDRRRGEPDRRVGMPDSRTERAERRSIADDRRSGAFDRRRELDAVYGQRATLG